MKKEYSIFIYWSTLLSGNMGVNALAYSTIFLLEKVAKRLDVSFKYTIVGTHSVSMFAAYSEPAELSTEINKETISYTFIPINLFTIRKAYNNFSPKYNALLKKADFIIDLGAGDSFSDIYGIKRLINLLLTKIKMLSLKKKLILFPQTIGPFANPILKKLANFVMNKADTVFARDIASYKYLEENKIRNSFNTNLDIAFILPFKKTDSTDNKIKIGLNISGLLFFQDGNVLDNFGIKYSYKKLISRFIKYFLSQENTELHIIGHVFSGKNEFDINNPDDDYPAMIKIQKEFPEVKLSPIFKSPSEAKSYISSMDFFMGSRMHACIAAFSAGVPTALLAYSRKFSGLFKESLNYNHVIDLYSLTENEVFEKTIQSFANRDGLKQEIADKKNNIEIKINNLEDIVTQKINEIINS